MTVKPLIASLLALGIGLSLPAAAGSTDPRVKVEIFSRALARGDEQTVRKLLLPNALVYESGGVEHSFDEYARHHLAEDIAFMKQMKRKQLSQSSGGDDQTAWVATRSRLRGRYKDKNLDLDSTETLVLTWTQDGWRIAHIHWSSAPHRNPNS